MVCLGRTRQSTVSFDRYINYAKTGFTCFSSAQQPPKYQISTIRPLQRAATCASFSKGLNGLPFSCSGGISWVTTGTGIEQHVGHLTAHTPGHGHITGSRRRPLLIPGLGRLSCDLVREGVAAGTTIVEHREIIGNNSTPICFVLQRSITVASSD